MESVDFAEELENYMAERREKTEKKTKRRETGQTPPTVIIRTLISETGKRNEKQREKTLKKCNLYLSAKSEIIEDDLGEFWLNIAGSLKDVARALDAFTKESFVAVTAHQHGHLIKVYLLSSLVRGKKHSHKKKFEIRVLRAECFGFKLHQKIKSYLEGKDDDSQTNLGPILLDPVDVKTEPEPVECVNCQLVKNEKRKADNEIMRREREKQALVEGINRMLEKYLAHG
ncbi:Oidioi.mRNA.OKI2018_I69.XSR.g16874.t1.cds [Oikopleura dioica]|uniref:Oidioi.mRNA.OKI2018_I69.XSR.g16874.t1.cds n=1 Tax=Oikopleura dioica TaxID=34765 RepID=A0ABN7SRU5_OIKDI|nr:Oidioi.mRNA.OKI2018_I69.XSR.g16874.t1.cds [Oikopleura dioica]